MPLVVIAGPPGAGKTTLLLELARRGHTTLSDSTREVIAERKAAGLAPRPSPAAFAREVYRRDLEKYRGVVGKAGLYFFERTALESRAMLLEATDLRSERESLENDAFEFSNPVFVLPPWREIYRTDSERDHTFEHAVRVHEQVNACYRGLGYQVHEVPRCSPAERADHVLDVVLNIVS